MKADAAAIRIVDWVGQQMIHIDRQSRQHDEIIRQPGFAVENRGKDKWDQEVKSKVENCLVLFEGLDGRSAFGLMLSGNQGSGRSLPRWSDQPTCLSEFPLHEQCSPDELL